MATKVIVCPECESPLVPGRFSCSSCGALLASVASVSRSFRPEPERTEPVETDLPVPASFEADEVVADDVENLELGWSEPDPTPSVAVHLPPPPAPEVDEAPAAVVASPVAGPVVAEAAPSPSWPTTPTWPTQQPAQAAPAWPTQPAWPASQPVAAQPAWPSAQPAETQAAWPVAQPAEPQPAWPAQPGWPGPEVPVTAAPPERTPAGAYLPPSAVLPSGDALPVPADAAPANSKPNKSLSERFALGEGDGPLGLPVNAPGRTVAFGAAIAGFGFLLPWAEIVIGSGSMGSFFDQWGLAGPGNVLVFLLLFGVGALAVAHERFPITVSTGLPALVLGSILLGLVFPYVMGPFHEAIGVYVVAVGGVVMIVGGLLSRAATRHAAADASV